MKTSYKINSLILPKEGKRIDTFDKRSKYIVKVIAPTDLSDALFKYAEKFYIAAHKIVEHLLSEHISKGKLDRYIFTVTFLYRHCLELGLKAVGFQYILDVCERKNFIHDTRHNLADILEMVVEKSDKIRTIDEIEWLRRYFKDMSQVDRESDSFRYPFHIIWEKDERELGNSFTIKEIFNKQIDIDLLKFANKFEAAHEIIEKWYLNRSECASEWKKVEPIFIETGGGYYESSVVGYKCYRYDFSPYVMAYLETANYLKWYMKKETDLGHMEYKEQLFLPMCYLYRNCVELSMKMIFFEDIGEDFQTKCKIMMNTKHSICGLWRRIKPYVSQYSHDKRANEQEYIDVIDSYCMQVHEIDSDANKFRYPMSNIMQSYFSVNKRFDFMNTGDFFEALNNILGCIDLEFRKNI